MLTYSECLIECLMTVNNCRLEMRACGSSKSQPIFWCEYGGEPCSLSSGHIACEAHKKRHILLHLPIRSAPTSAPVLGSGLFKILRAAQWRYLRRGQRKHNGRDRRNMVVAVDGFGAGLSNASARSVLAVPRDIVQ